MYYIQTSDHIMWWQICIFKNVLMGTKYWYASFYKTNLHVSKWKFLLLHIYLLYYSIAQMWNVVSERCCKSYLVLMIWKQGLVLRTGRQHTLIVKPVGSGSRAGSIIYYLNEWSWGYYLSTSIFLLLNGINNSIYVIELLQA